MDKTLIYKEIKASLPYQLCRTEVLAHLPSKFTYDEFEYVFILAFNPEKKGLILNLGKTAFRKWLKQYYLNKVAYKYKPSPSFKGSPQKWVAYPAICLKRGKLEKQSRRLTLTLHNHR